MLSLLLAAAVATQPLPSGWSATGNDLIVRADAHGTYRTEESYQDMHLAIAFRCDTVCGGAIVLRDGGVRVSLDAKSPLALSAGADLPVSPVSPVQLTPGTWHRLELTLTGDRLAGWYDNTRLESWIKQTLPGAVKAGAVLISPPAGSGRGMRYRLLDIGPADERRTQVPTVGAGFSAQQLDPLFYAETVAVADVDRDGHQDILSGPRYYLGPDFLTSREIYAGKAAGPDGFSSAPLSVSLDADHDGWPDLITMRGGQPEPKPLILYLNPKGQNQAWKSAIIFRPVTSESMVASDLNKDGLPEIVLQSDGVIGYVQGDPAQPTAPWTFHAVSARADWGPHGIGVGDLNGDGRKDIIGSGGWWEQPASPTAPWTYHPTDFGQGPNMLVTDVDGDGLADVISADNAHGWGISWYRQVRTGEIIRFVRHAITTVPVTRDPTAFSEPHALALADVDGDGLPDVVSGKRWWAHLDTALDADAQGQPVVYWYRLERNAKEVRFVPHLVSNQAAIGTQILAKDVNGDGRVDIVVAGRRGLWLFAGSAGER